MIRSLQYSCHYFVSLHKSLFVKRALLSFFADQSWQNALRAVSALKKLGMMGIAGILMAIFTLFPAMTIAAQKQSALEVQEVRSEFYQAGSGMVKIRDFEKLNNGTLKKVDLMLSMKSDIVMSDEQEQMLLNGIPLTFVYDIRIQERGFWSFWHGNNYAKEIRYLLFYHGLSKQFVVRDIETKKQHSYPTLSLALLSISMPTNIEFRITDDNGIHIEHFKGQAKLWLDIEALPTPLRIPAYLSKNWWLNSNWLQWELKI